MSESIVFEGHCEIRDYVSVPPPYYVDVDGKDIAYELQKYDIDGKRVRITVEVLG